MLQHLFKPLRLLIPLMFLHGCTGGAASNVQNVVTAPVLNNGPSPQPSPFDVNNFYHGVYAPAGPSFDLRRYGGDPLGQKSSSTALAAAAAACRSTGGGVITTGPGRFIFDAALQALPPNCWIEGAGRDVTTFAIMDGAQIGAIVYQTAPALNVGIEGITFDCNHVLDASALQFVNPTNDQIILRHDRFINANDIWSLVVGGASYPGDARETTLNSQFIDNVVEQNATGTREVALFVSWQNGVIATNQFQNNSGRCCSHAAGLYGYSTNDIVAQNSFYNPAQYGDFYVQQAQNILITLNRHVAGNRSSTLTDIINSRHVDIESDTYDLSASPTAVGIGIVDFNGALFDEHSVLITDSQDIRIEQSEFIGGYAGVTVPADNTSGHNVAQTHIIISGNHSFGSPAANLVVVDGANAKGVNDIEILANVIDGGNWSQNGGVSLVNGNSRTSNIIVDQNTIGFSPGAGAHAIDISGAFPSVYVQNNNLSAWSSANAILISGDPTIIATGNTFSP